MSERGDLRSGLPERPAEEVTDVLVRHGPVRIERIVSHGHTSAPGAWYDQVEEEWVLLLEGGAELEFDDGRRVALRPLEWVHLPAHRRHRVAWTDPACNTIWLAVFWNPSAEPGRPAGPRP